jgi:uncharacterized membrane protein YozB (DUF420 family)
MQGIDGFLGTRASLMLDVVFLAMFAVLPAMGWSIFLVRYRRNYLWHKRVQLALGAVLLVAVAAFEVDMQWLTNWRLRAEPSPHYETGVVNYSLWIHLFFAVPTALVWIFVIVQGLRKIPNPPGPSLYSAQHMFWGRIAALEMTMTAITGWIFYWLAFVA